MRQRIATWGLLLPLLACSPSEPFLRPVHRLVESEHHNVAPGRPASHTLDSETRAVLRGYPERTAIKRRGITRGADARLTVRDFATPAEAAAGRVVVLPHVRAGDEGPWTPALPRVVPVERGEGGRDYFSVGFHSPIPPSDALQVFLRVLVPPSSPEHVSQTRPVEVPPEALLEFGFGLPRAARAGRPVTFTIEVCVDADCSTVFSERLPASAPKLWNDRTLPLDAYAGRHASFRFRTLVDGAEGAFSFPLWSDPTVYERSTRRADELDLILISLDTVRADHLTSYGFERDTTPFIDERIARRGTLFEHCVAPASTTGPSHMTMLTSVQPLVHGIIPMDPGARLADGIETLPERLRAHGFETGAVTENGPIAAERGFARGFGAYRENKQTVRGGRKIAVAETLERGRAWLRKQRDKRVFLFLHTYEPHTPYEPPARYARYFRNQPYTDPDLAGLPDKWKPLHYDQELRYTDDALAKFIRMLDAAGRLDRTVILLTSDHGEAFLEHGFLFHGPDLHEEVLHVPLMLVGPGIPAGVRIPEPVGLVDVMPTLLELAGAPKSAQAVGRSLVSLMNGDPGGVDWRARPLFSEAWQTKAAGKTKYVEQPTFSVRRGGHKLIRWKDGAGFRYAFYELTVDRLERHDRYAADFAPAQELRALLDAYEPASRELARELGEARLDEGPLDPEREEKLRALGYLD